MTRKGSAAGEGKRTKIGERVAKVMARAGFGSRREAETLIADGRVAVNGVPITSPAMNVTAADTVAVDGKPLPARERTRLFLYHKPRGLVTTHNDPQGRPTVFAALPKHLPRVLSVGRLDFGTEGLLLLTNDGGLARVLELPQTGWLRRYRVRAHGRVAQPQLDALRGGVTVEGVRYGPVEATLDREQGSNVWLTFAIREGKNREVRNVLRHLGLQVTRLIRVSFGPFQLGELAEGEVEEVKTRVLREQIGDRLAALASVDFTAPLHARDDEPPATTARPRPRRPRDDARPRRGEEAPRREGANRDAPGARPHASRSPGPRPGRDERPGRRDERPRRLGERDRPHREAGPGGRAGGRPEQARPERPFGSGARRDDRKPRDDRRPRPRQGRDDRFAKDNARDPAPKRQHRFGAGHVWRSHEPFAARPPRKGSWRGARRDATAPEGAPAERSTRRERVADRKGREVVVERVGQKPAERPAPRPKRPGRAPRRDRTSGPRPSRPRKH